MSAPDRIATLAREYRTAEDAFDALGYPSAGNVDDYDAARRRRREARAALDAALAVAPPTPTRGDLYRHVSTGDEWVWITATPAHVFLEGARPLADTSIPEPWACEPMRFATEFVRVPS